MKVIDINSRNSEDIFNKLRDFVIENDSYNDLTLKSIFTNSIELHKICISSIHEIIKLIGMQTDRIKPICDEYEDLKTLVLDQGELLKVLTERINLLAGT